ncbi:hypothetical protein HGRIS_006189 [Hohenbuehelia grisea]|uniref:Uncharacterized protein n=1 Tax=Hohenbuehelia grisea TaxID=104357 RepID=A0ABR3K014_9AGAR
MASTFLILSLCLPALVLADHPRIPLISRWLTHARRASSRNVPANGYYTPMEAGGSMLTKVPETFPEGLGEPINIILTGYSDEEVLNDNEDKGGLQNFFLSFGFSGECLGQHSGSNQGANLGDGHGYLNETAVMRWNYGDPALGSCKETIMGGNHFRYWVQNGPSGNSGAVFMAASYEMPIAQQHDIIVNGYNFGRDWVIGNMTNVTVPTHNLTNQTTYSTQTTWAGYTYASEIQYVSGLLSNSSEGINHMYSVGPNWTNAIDGLVAVITTKMVARPANSAIWGPSSPSIRASALALSIAFYSLL